MPLAAVSPGSRTHWWDDVGEAYTAIASAVPALGINRTPASRAVKDSNRSIKDSPVCRHLLCRGTAALGSRGRGCTLTSRAAAGGPDGCMCMPIPERSERRDQDKIKLIVLASFHLERWKRNSLAQSLIPFKSMAKIPLAFVAVGTSHLGTRECHFS